MKPKYFEFQSFRLRHDQSAHKIGTDGILLATWVQSDSVTNILDFGSGCGLISFIAAQRFPNTQVLGLEIDTTSHFESLENLRENPFDGRVQFKLGDLLQFDTEQKFELILSNPPYFEEEVLAPNQRRAKARALQKGQLLLYLEKLKELLSPDGQIAIILAMSTWTNNQESIEQLGLYPRRICKVQHQQGKAFKRVLVEIEKKQGRIQNEKISLYKADGQTRSEVYQNLSGNFLLDQ